MAPARPLKTTKCENCGKSVLSANYARHVKKAHPGVVINRVRKLKQFKCLLCNNYFALKMKSRHFRKKHSKEAGSNIPVNEEEGVESNIGEQEQEQEQEHSTHTSHSELIEAHHTKTLEAHKEVLQMVKRHLRRLVPGGSSRSHQELPVYLEIVEGCRPGEPISYEEYLRTDWTDHANNPELRYKYVICSQEEARIILENGYLAVPLVILPVFSKDFPIRDIDDYLDFLATKPRIDVHIYDSLQKEEGENEAEKEGKSKSRNGKNEAGKNFLLPEPMLSADAISTVSQWGKGPCQLPESRLVGRQCDSAVVDIAVFQDRRG
jgi:hypothetical protein